MATRYELNHIALRGWGDDSGDWVETLCGFVFSLDHCPGGEHIEDCAVCVARYRLQVPAAARP